ncbi:MAG: iron-containing alcohol dehydrogenase, partial [Gammaproteobacteria bacterium]
IDGLDDAAAAAAARDAVAGLVGELGLPGRLRDVGVSQDDFAALARDALEDMIVATNPRPVSSVEEVIELLHSAW